MISQLAKNVRQSLKEAFPNTLIKDEYHINYKGSKLFFDFHLPTLNVFIEVQGIQHTKFNEHFHGTAAAFRASKKRDRLKKEWVDLNDYTLVCINYDEIPITSKELLAKIEEAQGGRTDT
jgi:very-short-patch-repair endonuclease